MPILAVFQGLQQFRRMNSGMGGLGLCLSLTQHETCLMKRDKSVRQLLCSFYSHLLQKSNKTQRKKGDQNNYGGWLFSDKLPVWHRERARERTKIMCKVHCGWGGVWSEYISMHPWHNYFFSQSQAHIVFTHAEFWYCGQMSMLFATTKRAQWIGC